MRDIIAMQKESQQRTYRAHPKGSPYVCVSRVGDKYAAMPDSPTPAKRDLRRTSSQSPVKGRELELETD